MAKPKKRRKIVVFSVILLALAGLTTAAIVKKHDVFVTIQTEKVGRRNITELVVANGKIQPVLQVKISPEVSGEIIELPVKEGQCVQKGDLLVKIKPDFYLANRKQAEASYNSSVAGKATAEANLAKADLEYKRNQGLWDKKLVSESVYLDFKTMRDVAAAQLSGATHQVEMAKANLARVEEELSKTKIVAPLTGTVSKLNSQIGERVLGTIQNVGTEIMIIADLNAMEARVDVGETDVVLISPGQNVRLEVDAFKDKKFTGTVTEIANSSKTNPYGGGGSSQEATKFEVKIRIKEAEAFRPGMSITGEIETRSRSNVLTVPIASVTTRLPKEKKDAKTGKANGTNSVAKSSSGTNAPDPAAATNNVTVEVAANGTNDVKSEKKSKEGPKPLEVVFVVEGDHVKMVPVKIGISDDSYWEITDGLTEGQEVVSGGYRAISRDLEDGKKARKGPPPGEKEKLEEAKST